MQHTGHTGSVSRYPGVSVPAAQEAGRGRPGARRQVWEGTLRPAHRPAHLHDAGLQLLHRLGLAVLHGGAHQLPLHQAVLVQRPLVLVQHALLVPLTQVLPGGRGTSAQEAGDTDGTRCAASTPGGEDGVSCLETAHTHPAHSTLGVRGRERPAEPPGASCEGVTVQISSARNPRGNDQRRAGTALDLTRSADRPPEASAPPAARSVS